MNFRVAAALFAISAFTAHAQNITGAGATFTNPIYQRWFVEYSPEWEHKVDRAAAIKWQVGTGQKGNEGFSGLVRNAAGRFVKASTEAVTAAAAADVKSMPIHYRVSMTDARGADSYLISNFT